MNSILLNFTDANHNSRSVNFLCLGANQYRGGSGPLRVSRGTCSHPLHQTFLEAGVEAGYPFTEDINGYQQEGIGRLDQTIHEGRRWSAATAYLKPALHRKNLVTQTGALANRLLFENNQAIGVEYRVGNSTRCARASREVIVCGGVFNSPQLLMLSGIGDEDELKALGIPVVANLPGVGKNLQDHVQMYVQYVSIHVFWNVSANCLCASLLRTQVRTRIFFFIVLHVTTLDSR